MAVSRKQARGYAGVTKLRRLLRRLDSDLTVPIREAIADGAQAILGDMQMMVPVDKDELRPALSARVSRDGFTAVIGPAIKDVLRIGTKANTLARRVAGEGVVVDDQQLFQAYKALWIERGTKGSPEHNVPPQPARPFMEPAFDQNKQEIINRAQIGITVALRAAVQAEDVGNPND